MLRGWQRAGGRVEPRSTGVDCSTTCSIVQASFKHRPRCSVGSRVVECKTLPTLKREATPAPGAPQVVPLRIAPASDPLHSYPDAYVLSVLLANQECTGTPLKPLNGEFQWQKMLTPLPHYPSSSRPYHRCLRQLPLHSRQLLLHWLPLLHFPTLHHSSSLHLSPSPLASASSSAAASSSATALSHAHAQVRVCVERWLLAVFKGARTLRVF